MAKRKLYWKNSLKYQMILRYLEEYWLKEHDELFVQVDLTFLKANGEWQKKCISWFNPNYEVIGGDAVIKTLDMYPELPEPEIPYLDDIKAGRIVKVPKDD